MEARTFIRPRIGHWILAVALILGATGAARGAGPVMVVPLEGAIGPASADFARRAIERAPKAGAELVVLRIDTPGGLDTSMRELIKAILASPVPVAAYVAPSGARAASAGTFIVYAAHVAAMAPGTNLGAASPVAIGGSPPAQKDGKAGDEADVLKRKAINDAVAYLRGLAELRGRNAEWAEKAVRDGASLPAQEALRLKVVDHVAPDLPALLQALGRGGAELQEVKADWRTRVLAVITDPSIAYILLLVGLYALIIEFMSPGMIVPGVAGAITLLVALYALHLLPVSYAGLALILVGVGCMAAEAFAPSGALGVGGLVAFVLGSIMLIEDAELPEFEIPFALIGGVAAGSAALLVFVLGRLARSRRARAVSGREDLLAATGEALEDFEGEGWARVRGELWKVRAARPVRRGQRLRVTALRGLVLEVIAEGDDP